MKKLLVILSTVVICGTAGAQGIIFREGSLAETLAEAQQQDKLIFIDCYTSWCGPCKMMSSEVFPQQEAGDYFNARFINFKVDVEKSDDGKHIAGAYNVTAYPTFLFINGEGELVYRFLGAKSLEELIEEGGNALAALKVFPELKEFEQQYEGGDRDMDFLSRYSEVMAASGLDASRVLTDYLMRVDDNDLFSPANLSRIEIVTRYDSALSQRLMARLEQYAGEPEMDKKRFTAANSSVGKFFSGTIRNIANSGTEQQFEEYITMKERFLALGNSNSVSVAMMGGGSFYLPAQMLQLDYYKAKNDTERFVSIFERYMTDVRDSFAEIDGILESLKEGAEIRALEALERGDEVEAKGFRRSFGLMQTLIGIDNIYISTTLLEYIEVYDRYYPEARDDSYRDKLAEWYVYLSGVSPSVKTALYAADRLIEMDRHAEAAVVLDNGLEEGRDASEVTPELISEAEDKLAKLRDGK